MSERLSVEEANVNSALRNFYVRTGTPDMPVTDMAYDDFLMAESDGHDGQPDEYDMSQRRAAVRGLYRYFLAEGPHPLKIMKRVFAAGRGFRIDYFCTLTNEEAGLMFGETKAAHSWRVGFLSGLIELCGMKGSRLSGQKSKGSTKNYSAAQMGNQNRKKKTKR